MKSTVRSTLAAGMMLLASAGGMLVAEPALASPFNRSGPLVMISNFQMSAGTLLPGSVVRYRVEGASGGDAKVIIPGWPTALELKEVSPGVYEGTLVVNTRYDPRALTAATAEVQRGGLQATARLGGTAILPNSDDRRWERDNGRLFGADPRSRDRRAPEISDLTPSNGDRVNDRNNTRISARFSDNDSGIDPRAVSLRIDGRDVTGASRVDNDEIRFRGDLAPGRHVAEVVVTDRAGNVARRNWSFDVVDRSGRNYGYGYGYGNRW